MSKRALAQSFLSACLALVVGWWGHLLWTNHSQTEKPPSSEPRSSEHLCPDGSAPLYWRAPMDPSYVRKAPGKSPMGMDLVPECPQPTNPLGAHDLYIDASTVQKIGVRTAAVERRDISRTVRAMGRIAYDERRVAHIHTKVQGWVERLFVDYVGQSVEKGEPLLEIYSPELVATQEELLIAARYRQTTQESPFEEVRSGGESIFDAAKRRLELWDISQRDVDELLRTEQIEKTLTLYAPTSGIVTQLGVRSGMEVQSNDNLYTIADLSTVWALAQVYEFELPWIDVGQEGIVELSYLPGELFSGLVTYIAPFLDPKTRTAEVRLELPNRDGHLKPDMFGTTELQGATRKAALVIPSEAVIHSGRRSLVILDLGEGRFESREIAPGLDSGDGHIEVQGGLQDGDVVVVSSQFLIDSESKLREVTRKLLSAGE